jgi:hypothetical protein
MLPTTATNKCIAGARIEMGRAANPVKPSLDTRILGVLDVRSHKNQAILFAPVVR